MYPAVNDHNKHSSILHFSAFQVFWSTAFLQGFTNHQSEMSLVQHLQKQWWKQDLRGGGAIEYGEHGSVSLSQESGAAHGQEGRGTKPSADDILIY